MNIKNFLRDKDEKNLLVHIGLAFLIKGFSLLVSMISMPLYIKYFDDNVVLGLWYTILSILSWIQLCDLGLGNGLRNRLTEALAVGNYEKAGKSISSTYMVLILIMLPTMLIGCVAFRLLDFNAFFKVSQTLVPADTLCLTVSVLFCGICLNFVLKTINVVIYAIQQPSINNVLALITSILPLPYIALFKDSSLESNLVALTVVHVLTANLPLIVATFMVFRRKELRPIAPRLENCDLNTAKSMLRFGMQFFLAQIFFMFLTVTNEIIIARVFSAEAVVEYSIYFRLFTTVGSLFMLALTPLWSKVTKDLAQKEFGKIQKTNKVLYVLSVVAFIAEFALVAILQFAVDLWLRDEAIVVNRVTGLVFAFYGGMYILNVVLTTVANGIGDLRTQIVFYGIGSALKIPGIYALSGIFGHWRVVVLYNALVMLLFNIVQIIWVEKLLKKLKDEQMQYIPERSLNLNEEEKL